MTDTPDKQNYQEGMPSSQPILRRSQRHSEPIKTTETTESNDDDVLDTERPVAIAPLYKLYILLFSIILAGLSVTVPTFFDVASPLQMTNLYIGQSFSNGQLPYTEMFGTGGLIYYATIAGANYLGSSMWLIFVELLVYIISGLYFFKIIQFLSEKTSLAAAFLPVFYLLNLALGLGGLYAMQWATPFMMIGLWLLLLYFTGKRRDEWFISYGVVAALSVFIEARSLIFWSLAFVSLTVFNITRHRWKQGFYQNLCLLWGGLVVSFIVGYFALDSQLLLPYIQQTILYGLTYLGTGQDSLIVSLAVQLLVVVGSGLLYGLVFFFAHLKQEKSFVVIKWLLWLTTIIYLVYAFLAQTIAPYHLLAALPFGLIMTALAIDQAYEKKVQAEQDTTDRTLSGSIWNFFMKRHLYLPILVVLAGLGLGGYRYATEVSLDTERQLIAQYIAENTADTDKIYAWDTSTGLYVMANRGSASQFILPEVDTSKSSHQALLQDQLLQHSATYLVINTKLDLPDTVQADLKKYYEEIVSDSVSHFKIYHLK